MKLVATCSFNNSIQPHTSPFPQHPSRFARLPLNDVAETDYHGITPVCIILNQTGGTLFPPPFYIISSVRCSSALYHGDFECGRRLSLLCFRLRHHLEPEIDLERLVIHIEPHPGALFSPVDPYDISLEPL